MTKTLEMVFRNAGGTEVSLQLADPKDAITKLEVNTAMQNIITKNIFTTSGGDLVDIVDAQIRVRDTLALV